MIKSYKFWVGLAGSVGLFLTAISENLGIVINAEGVKEIIMAFCGVLIAIGIVQKPKSENLKPTLENAGEENKYTKEVTTESEKEQASIKQDNK
ncbi:MAG: hypothetical protein IJW25_01070 [Clostridia bacterium]|nr:hypothetical protein [Clostridia bacterium]